MHIFPVSPEQDKLANYISHKPLAFVRYLDEDYKYNSVVKMVFDNLWKKKRSVIITSNANQAAKYVRLFQNMQIGNQVLNAFGNDQIAPSDIARLRTDYKSIDLNTSSDSLSRLQVTEQNKQEKTIATLLGLTNKTLGTLDWVRIREQQDILKANHPCEPYLDHITNNGMALEQAEFYAMRSTITKAVQYYESEYNYIRHLDIIHPQAYQRLTLVKLYETIEKTTDELGDIVYRLDAEIRELEKDLYEGLSKIKSAINNLLDDGQIELQIVESAKPKKEEKGAWFGFKKKDKAPTEQAFPKLNTQLNFIKDQLANVGLDQAIDLNQIESKEEINILNEALSQLLNNWSQISSNIVNHRMKRYNVHNVNSDSITQLDLHYTEVLNNLKAENLLSQEYENVSNNLNTQRESAKNILVELQKTCYLINTYPDYIEWKRFSLVNDAKTQEVLNNLCEVPKNLWLQHFDQWYFTLCLDKQRPKDLKQLPLLLESQNAANNVMYQEVLKQIEQNWRYLKSEQIAHLKNINSALYSDLFKKKIIVNQSYTDLIHANDHLLTTMFPVVIIDANSYSELRYKKSNICHSLYIEDPEEIKELDLLHIEQIAKHTMIISAYSQNLNEYSHLGPFADEQNTFKLTGCISTVNQELSDMSSNEKLVSCKKLTKLLFSFSKKPKVYQSKNACIITFASDYQTQQFIASGEWHGIRQQDDDQLSHKVTEALLASDKRQYLLIQDGVLSSQDGEYFKWQLNIIKQLKIAGINVVNQWTEGTNKEMHAVLNNTEAIIENENEKLVSDQV